MKLFNKENKIKPIDEKTEKQIISENVYNPSFSYGDELTLTNEKSLHYAPVYTALNLISKTISNLPIHLYKKDGESSVIVSDHNLAKLLKYGTNSEMTWQDYFASMITNFEAHGIAYAQILRSKYGDIQELWPISPLNLQETRNSKGQLIYTYIPTGKKIPSSEILRVKNTSINGLTHVSPIATCKNIIKLGLSVDSYHEQFYRNNVASAGYISSDATIDDTDKARYSQQYQSARKQGETPFLDQGTKFTNFGLKLSDQEINDSRKAVINSIAGIFGLKPFMLGVTDDMNYSNLQAMRQEGYQFTWLPKVKAWETNFEKFLLTQLEREQGYFIKINMDGLIRADILTRMDVYTKGINNGLYNADECRKLEDLPEQPNGIGKKYFIPLNMIDKSIISDTIEQTEAVKHPSVQKKIEEQKIELKESAILKIRDNTVRSYEPILRKSIDRLLNEDKKIIDQKLKEISIYGVDYVIREITTYLKNRKPEIKTAVEGVYKSLGTALIDSVETELNQEIDRNDIDTKIDKYVDNYTSRYVADLVGRTKRIQDDEEYYKEQEIIDQNYKNSIIDEEKTRFKNAVIRSCYLVAGITLYKSVANAGACPMCSELNNKVVGIDYPIVSKGEDITGVTSSSNRFHPPYHKGCTCSIIAVTK